MEIRQCYIILIGQIIQILQQVDAEHQFKLIGFISVLPLVVVRSDQLLQLFPRHNPPLASTTEMLSK